MQPPQTVMYIVQSRYLSQKGNHIWIKKKIKIHFTILQALLFTMKGNNSNLRRRRKKKLISNTQQMESLRMMMAQNTKRQGIKWKQEMKCTFKELINCTFFFLLLFFLFFFNHFFSVFGFNSFYSLNMLRYSTVNIWILVNR